MMKVLVQTAIDFFATLGFVAFVGLVALIVWLQLNPDQRMTVTFHEAETAMLSTIAIEGDD